MLLVVWSRGHFPSFSDSAPSFHPDHRKSEAGDRVKSSKLPGGAPILGPGTPWPDESKLQAIRQRMGRPGTTVAIGEAEERLKPRSDQIRAWRGKDHLLLTKVHELLGRKGLWFIENTGFCFPQNAEPGLDRKA